MYIQQGFSQVVTQLGLGRIQPVTGGASTRSTRWRPRPETAADANLPCAYRAAGYPAIYAGFNKFHGLENEIYAQLWHNIAHVLLCTLCRR